MVHNLQINCSRLHCRRLKTTRLGSASQTANQLGGSIGNQKNGWIMSHISRAHGVCPLICSTDFEMKLIINNAD